MLPRLPQVSAIILLLLIALPSSWAQQRYDNRYNDAQRYQGSTLDRNALYVTVYEDCEFRGNSRALAIGDYRNVRELNLGNDAISSVAVPEGLELILYEHEDLRGDSTLIGNNVPCLNSTWNDQASSLKVRQDQQALAQRSRNPATFETLEPRGPSQRFETEPRGADARVLGRQAPATKVSMVEFAQSALEQRPNGQWVIQNKNGSVDQFRELFRDNTSVTLQHMRINQQVRIDLAANQVQFFAPNGNRVDYAISSKNTEVRNRQAVQSGPSGVINGACFNYRAYTRGGQGGIRFHGHDGFHRFNTKAHNGRICHNGPLTMEINKNQKSTDVLIDINGETYRFAPNEQEDVLLNTWYRKKVRLTIGR